MRKTKIDIVETVVDNDEVVSTWSVHISKYVNLQIVARKSERNVWPKSQEKQYHDDSVYQNPCNKLLGG